MVRLESSVEEQLEIRRVSKMNLEEARTFLEGRGYLRADLSSQNAQMMISTGELEPVEALAFEKLVVTNGERRENPKERDRKKGSERRSVKNRGSH